jgi:putative Mn2+ efflux pump MntP
MKIEFFLLKMKIEVIYGTSLQLLYRYLSSFLSEKKTWLPGAILFLIGLMAITVGHGKMSLSHFQPIFIEFVWPTLCIKFTIYNCR